MNTTARRHGLGVLLVALMTALLGLLSPRPATAAAPTSGDLTIVMERNLGSGPVPLAGLVFEVRHVPDVDPLTESGKATIVHLEDELDAGRPPATDELRTSPATDATGHTVITNLAVGVYLVHPTNPRMADGSIYRDFLVAIPTQVDPSAQAFDLLVMPKAQQPPATPSPRPTPTPVEQVPAPRDVPTPSARLGARINSGGGSGFSGRAQWLTLAATAAGLVVVFARTRRSRKSQDAG